MLSSPGTIPWRPAVLAGALLACIAVVPASGAVPQEGARPGPEAAAAQRLRQEVDQRFRVGLLRDGVVLIPREPGRGFGSIEISNGTVSIDGTAVTGRELRARLGRDADLVLSLSYLDPVVRREAFREDVGAETPAEPPVETKPPPAPERPEAPPGRLGRVVPAEPSPLDRYTTRSDTRIRIGGPVYVGEDELVRGPVVAVGGPVTVNGGVYDNVVAIGGGVTLGPRADVRGDVTSVGGTIDRAPGARVRGQLNEIGFNLPPIRLRVWPFTWHRPALNGSFSLLLTAFRMLLVTVLALAVLLIARRPVERIADAAAAEPWKAGAVGLLTQLLVLPVLILTLVVLVISIIGIPLVFVVPPLIVLALAIAFVLGFTGVGYAVGRWAGVSFRWRIGSAVAALIVGFVAIWILTLAGRIVGVVGWPVWIVSASLLVLGFLVEYAAWTVGLGAALMTRFGSRPVTIPAPAVPPTEPGDDLAAR